MSKKLRVGVIGYSSQGFDVNEARRIIRNIFNTFEKKEGKNVNIVSGLTNLGIPKIAYEESVKRGWTTTGIACKKAKEFNLFDVDNVMIKGKEWGDESKLLLDNIDILIKVGGGKQSEKELEKAKDMGIKTFSFKLNSII